MIKEIGVLILLEIDVLNFLTNVLRVPKSVLGMG